jgi:hypothetical protein
MFFWEISMTIRKSIPLALLACLSAVACQNGGVETFDETVTYAGPRSVLVAKQIDPVNLPLLISSAIRDNSLRHECGSYYSGNTNADVQAIYACIRAFSMDPGAGDEKRLLRNQIQDHLVMVAASRCQLYKRVLTVAQADTQFGFGALATILGGFGTIVGSESTARALAGGAGVTAGVGAEFDNAYFRQQAVYLINAGIDLKTSEIHNEIGTKQQKPLAEYSLQTAIADAIRYNGACTISEGLYKLKDQIAIHGSGEVGLNRANEIIKASRLARAKDDLNTIPANTTSSTEKSKRADAQIVVNEEATAEIAREIASAKKDVAEGTTLETAEKEKIAAAAPNKGKCESLGPSASAADRKFCEDLNQSVRRAADLAALIKRRSSNAEALWEKRKKSLVEDAGILNASQFGEVSKFLQKVNKTADTAGDLFGAMKDLIDRPEFEQLEFLVRNLAKRI